jgi:hypothetical protein
LTALARGENPLDWKPIACSLWPLAVTDYKADGGAQRLLLTIYCDASAALFDADDEPFACLEDEDPRYPRTYEAERAALEYFFGADWWRELDLAARRILRAAH